MNRCTVTAVPGEQGISFSRESDAPATRVFRAYTDPTLLRQWTGPQGSELVIRDFVARTGGLYNYRIAGPEWGAGVFRIVSRSHGNTWS